LFAACGIAAPIDRFMHRQTIQTAAHHALHRSYQRSQPSCEEALHVPAFVPEKLVQLLAAWAHLREILLRHDGFVAIADADISDDVDAAERAFEDEGPQASVQFHMHAMKTARLRRSSGVRDFTIRNGSVTQKTKPGAPVCARLCVPQLQRRSPISLIENVQREVFVPDVRAPAARDKSAQPNWPGAFVQCRRTRLRQ
jgi:hypothetical protein